MNKKTMIIMIVVFITILIIGGGLYFMFSNKEDKKDTNTKTKETEKVEDNNTTTGSKVLVVYYSAQNHTEAVAKQIAENLDADIFEVIPKDVYTTDDLDWTDSNSRVTKEHDDESLRNIELETTDVPNWEDYDTVLIGYPIWWGIAAWSIDNFVKNNDFTGKTVIPFCTSSSSGLGESARILEGYANGGNWRDGHRFSSSASDSDIKSFTDSIK